MPNVLDKLRVKFAAAPAAPTPAAAQSAKWRGPSAEVLPLSLPQPPKQDPLDALLASAATSQGNEEVILTPQGVSAPNKDGEYETVDAAKFYMTPGYAERFTRNAGQINDMIRIRQKLVKRAMEDEVFAKKLEQLNLPWSENLSQLANSQK